MPGDPRGARFPFAALAGELGAALAAGPDPAGSRAWLARLLESAGSLPVPAVLEEQVVALASALLSQSPYLSTLLVREPGLLLSLAGDPFLHREKPARILRDALLEATGDAPDAAALARALRRFRQREYVRIGVREIGYGSPVEVGRELSGLADAAFEAAIEWHAKRLADSGPPLTETGRRCRFVVFGMGKLGGEELNFSSDVDVIYLYETDAGMAGSRTLHEYFARLCERVTRTIGDVTDDGFVFRVDLRLRPEGSRGAIVNSLPSAERYYESFGRPWERQAWLKARPIAGDRELGAEALALLEPFIYPRTISPDTVENVRDLRRRMTAETRAREAAEALALPGSRTRRDGPLGPIIGYDVKLGEGGIREVEFFVQALQLVHAGKRPGLRAKGTLRALDQLLFAGLVSDREQRALGAAYVFLRKIEHRIQMEGGLHTHAVPETPEAIELLARRLGFVTGLELATALEAARAEVRSCYATLGELAGAEDRIPPAVFQLLDPRRTGEELYRPLAQLGFRDLTAAAFELDLLRTKPYSPLGPTASGPAARLAPELLAEIAGSPDPDLALRHTVDLVGRRGAGAAIWRWLDESRPALRLVASLFGTSDYLAKLFLAHPELLDQLLLAGRGEPRRSREALRVEVLARVCGADGFEDTANALRRFQHEELLRIGLSDVAGTLEADEVVGELSDLADALVAETLALVSGELAARGKPLVPLAVIGLGKLGARELGYGSDLDVIFVFDAPDSDLEAGEHATRLAQRLIGALAAHMEEGRLYEVDTRLRPSGRMGTLVSSLDALRRYHAQGAQLWERQALIKARAVAGDPVLGAAVEALAHEVVYGHAAPGAADTAAEIARLRARMEREIAQERGGKVNLKAGRGGLVDIEFIAQLLQLVHGADMPALQVRTAREALAAARDRGLISPDDYTVLDDAYRFLRRLEARVRMVHDRALSDLDLGDAVEMEKLARRMGVLPTGADSAAAALRELYARHTERVRSVYDRWFPRA